MVFTFNTTFPLHILHQVFFPTPHSIFALLPPSYLESNIFSTYTLKLCPPSSYSRSNLHSTFIFRIQLSVTSTLNFHDFWTFTFNIRLFANFTPTIRLIFTSAYKIQFFSTSTLQIGFFPMFAYKIWCFLDLYTRVPVYPPPLHHVQKRKLIPKFKTI